MMTRSRTDCKKSVMKVVVRRWSLVVGIIRPPLLAERPRTNDQRLFLYTNAGLEWTGGGSNSKGLSRRLAPRHHFCWRSAIHVGLIEYDVRSHMCWLGSQHHLLAVNQVGRVETRQFEPVA